MNLRSYFFTKMLGDESNATSSSATGSSILFFWMLLGFWVTLAVLKAGAGDFLKAGDFSLLGGGGGGCKLSINRGGGFKLSINRVSSPTLPTFFICLRMLSRYLISSLASPSITYVLLIRLINNFSSILIFLICLSFE